MEVCGVDYAGRKRMINSGLYSSATDEWATPKELFRQLDNEFHFDLDPCATGENHKCDKYYTIADDGLRKPWGGREFSAIPLMGNILRIGYARHTKQIWNTAIW